MQNKKIEPNLIASMIGDEPAKFNHLQCTLVKYSDSIDELAEAVVRHDMVGVVRVLSEDIDTLINEGPLSWAKKKLGWGKDKEAEAGAEVEPDDDSKEVADAMEKADTDRSHEYGHHSATTDKQTEWEEKYKVVYDWLTSTDPKQPGLLQRLSDPSKKALGNKPSWMMADPDMQKLLKALSNELYHRSKGLKPTYYSKGAKRPGKVGRPGRSISKGYEGDIV